VLESRWPKGPLITLIVLIPALIILNPFIKGAVHSLDLSARAAALSTQYAPENQGGYVVNQIDSLASKYWRRIAGSDTNLPPHVNGHDEFAAAWLKTMRQNLRGLPIGTFTQYGPVPGFQDDVATRPGKNVMVIVPGTVHPGEAVVIGSHYDGDPHSHGSAYDDTSGSSVILGLARSLGAYWRANGLPRLTVEFCIFDAEEEGVVGSGDYLFFYRHGAIMPHPVMMIDEEQTGEGYPVHPFGRAAEPLLPEYAITTVQNSEVKHLFHPFAKLKRAAIATMSSRLLQDRSDTFVRLHAVYPTLALQGGSVPAFTLSQEKDVIVGPTPVCCSDNAPFEALGLPTVTFSGNFQFYNHPHPDWALPFDQAGDTPAALACATGGSPTPSASLQAALLIPLVMSYDLVNQYAPPGPPLHSFAVITARAVAGMRTEFSAAGPGPITWWFGDGTHAEGGTVLHQYSRPGTYTIRIHSPTATASGPVSVEPTVREPHLWSNIPTGPKVRRFHPKELNGVAGCP